MVVRIGTQERLVDNYSSVLSSIYRLIVARFSCCLTLLLGDVKTWANTANNELFLSQLIISGIAL